MTRASSSGLFAARSITGRSWRTTSALPTGVANADGLWLTAVRDVLTGSRLPDPIARAHQCVRAVRRAVNATSGEPTTHRHVFSRGFTPHVPRLSASTRVLTFFATTGGFFFVIPMGPLSCIGTTDTRVASPETVVSEADRRFVLDNINKRLRLAKPLTPDDILAERCGVRPLAVDARGDTATHDWTPLSRKHAVELDPRTATSASSAASSPIASTSAARSRRRAQLGVVLPVRGAKWYGEPDHKIRDEFLHRAALLGLDAMTAPESSEPMSKRLWRRYGWRALSLLEDIRQDPRMAEVLIKGTEYTRCELYHAAQHEMVTRLEDFLRRRSKIALIARRDTIRQAPGPHGSLPHFVRRRRASPLRGVLYG